MKRKPPIGFQIPTAASLVCIDALEPRTLLAGIVFPVDAGVIDVTSSTYGARPNDGLDDTAAIQKALSAFPSGNRIIYLPDGVYDVSDTLRWPIGSGTGAGNYSKRTILQGQSRDGTIIRLADASPGFTDPAAVKVVVFTGDGSADRFRNSVRDLTISTGRNNPGAAAITFNASNQGTMDHVLLKDEDNRALYGMVWSAAGDSIGPMLIRDVEIQGFDIGIRPQQQIANIVFEDLRLTNQRTYGIKNQNQNLIIRNLTATGPATVLLNEKDSRAFTVIDNAVLTGTGSASTRPAILNQRELYLRNISTSGYQTALVHNDKGRGNEPGVYGPYIHEWGGSKGNLTSLFENAELPLNLDVKESPDVPWDGLSNWVSPKAYGGVAGDSIDDTAAIQAAIDSGKTTVYLPNGKWLINGTLVVRGNVRRIIGTEANIDGSGTIRFDNGTQPLVVFERIDTNYASIKFVHNTSRAVKIANVSGGKYSNTPQGTGDLFIDDWVAAPFVFRYGQHVWARQIDQETNTQATADPTDAKIVNDGAVVWMLGVKSENPGTVVRTQNGGITEIIGSWNFANGSAKTEPAFINDNSSVSISGARTYSFSNVPYTAFVTETRGGVSRTLPNFVMGYAGYSAPSTSLPPEVTIDSEDATGVIITGAWTASTNSINAWHGTSFLTDGNAAKGTKSVTFTPTLGSAGKWEVFLKWTGGSGRATNVPVDIVHADGTSTVLLNQVQNGSWGISLGAYRFRGDGTEKVVIRTTGTNGTVVADAVQFVRRALTPVVSTPVLAPQSDTGVSNSDRITRLASIILTGTATPGTTVEIWHAGISIGSASATSTGDYAVAAALAQDGVYSLTATTTDADGNRSDPTGPLSVTLDTHAPRVAGVSLAGSKWSSTFLSAMQSAGAGVGGFDVPGGASQTTTLPWTNLDRIAIRFTEAVNSEASDMVLSGVRVPAYSVSGFARSGSDQFGTWSLPASIGADRLAIRLASSLTDVAGNALDGEWTNGVSAFPSGNGSPGGALAFVVNVVPGDVNRNGVTSSSDQVLVRNALGTGPASVGYSIFLDLNADGAVLSSDQVLVRNNISASLPVASATATLQVRSAASNDVSTTGRPAWATWAQRLIGARSLTVIRPLYLVIDQRPDEPDFSLHSR